jgi:hypothetical protein
MVKDDETIIYPRSEIQHERCAIHSQGICHMKDSSIARRYGAFEQAWTQGGAVISACKERINHEAIVLSFLYGLP